MRLISFDIETWGLKDGYTLQPWHVKTKESGVLSVAVHDGTATVESPFCPSKEAIKKTLSLAQKGDLLCGWNLKFDLAFLLATGMESFLKNFKYLDGMLLLKKLGYQLPSYALKSSLAHFSDHIKYEKNYEVDIEFKIGDPKKAYSFDEMNKMLVYNRQDTIYTRRLIAWLIERAPRALLRQVIRESTVSMLFADAWQHGILLDTEELIKLEKTLSENIKKFDPVFEKIGLFKKIIASPAQLTAYLTDKLQIELTEQTDKGNLSVATPVLKNIYHKHSGIKQRIIGVIIKYKELMAEGSKFINSAVECVKESPLIHPDPQLCGTYTGRLTYSIYQTTKKKKVYKNGNETIVNAKIKTGIPIHQIKKKGAIRRLFVAPKDHFIAELDFSAQEVRLIACVANEPTMIKIFNEEKDMHAFTAAEIAGKSYEEFQALKEKDPKTYRDMRYLGKLTNLSLQYRLSAPNLYKQWHDIYGLTNKTREDAEQARGAYLRLYSGIPRYWEQSVQRARMDGYTENMAHRRHYLKDWAYDKEYKSSQIAINFPIQSTGAEQKILGLYILREFLQGNDIKLAWDLHDGLYFYVPYCMMAHDLVLEMRDILSNLPYEEAWDWSPQVKFPVEAKIGKRWGELDVI